MPWRGQDERVVAALVVEEAWFWIGDASYILVRKKGRGSVGFRIVVGDRG